MNSQKQLLENLFLRFGTRQIPYCILHSYDELPERIVSDVDICIDIDDDARIDNHVYKICYKNSLLVIQKIYYGVPNLVAYDISDSEMSMKVAQMDFFNDKYGISWLSINKKDLLNGRLKYRSFYIPNEKNEFIYLFIKRIYKGQLLAEHKQKLIKLYQANEREINTSIEKYFGLDGVRLLARLLHSGNEEYKSILLKLRTTFNLRQIVARPWKLILRGFFKSLRIRRRVGNPTGHLVVILSPDGGGKSSVAKAVLEKLLVGFRKTEYLHWRPGFLPQIRTLLGKAKLDNEFVAANPHNLKSRDRISSFLRWVYYLFDYIIGYYLKIFPMKIRTTAVVMDRYYYDIVVDPVRYGFNLPQWLIKSILPIIPKPDITIYLDNESEELYKRKQELPIAELKRQVEAWREFIPHLPNARIIATDKPLDAVVHDVTRTVLGRRAEMTRKMLRVDPDESCYVWQTDTTEYLALPSARNCRWIMPGSREAFRHSWDLYRPYSIKGKLYKTVYKFMGSRSPFISRKSISSDSLNSDKSSLLKNKLREIFAREDVVMAISTGTPSPFRKITGLAMSLDGESLACVKIGDTPLAIERLKNEAKMLKAMGKRSWVISNGYGLKFPELLYEGDIEDAQVIIQSPAPFEGKTGRSYFSEDYANILNTLLDGTAANKKFSESEFYRGLKEGVNNYSLSYKDQLEEGLKYVEDSVGDKEIAFALCHGDFAPWNMIWNSRQVFIYDWESANCEAPAGIDLVHFLFQTAFLLKRQKGEKLLKHILYNASLPSLTLPVSEIVVLLYFLHMALTEDEPQQLSSAAVERRKLLKILIHN